MFSGGERGEGSKEGNDDKKRIQITRAIPPPCQAPVGLGLEKGCAPRTLTKHAMIRPKPKPFDTGTAFKSPRRNERDKQQARAPPATRSHNNLVVIRDQNPQRIQGTSKAHDKWSGKSLCLLSGKSRDRQHIRVGAVLK